MFGRRGPGERFFHSLPNCPLLLWSGWSQPCKKVSFLKHPHSTRQAHPAALRAPTGSWGLAFKETDTFQTYREAHTKPGVSEKEAPYFLSQRIPTKGSLPARRSQGAFSGKALLRCVGESPGHRVRPFPLYLNLNSFRWEETPCRFKKRKVYFTLPAG